MHYFHKKLGEHFKLYKNFINKEIVPFVLFEDFEKNIKLQTSDNLIVFMIIHYRIIGNIWAVNLTRAKH